MLPNVILFNGTVGANSGLWQTDGTGPDTFPLQPIALAAAAGLAINPQNFSGVASIPFAVSNGDVLFNGADAAATRDLWETNGTTGGTFQLTTANVNPQDLTAYNGETLFAGASAGLEDLWVTTGTVAGTLPLTGIANASATVGLDPLVMAVYNGKVLFNGIDAANKRTLWETDGTVAGTTELVQGGAAGGISPIFLTPYKGKVLFNGVDPANNRNLWVTDGTAAGTSELTGIANAAAQLDPFDITVFNGLALFEGVDTANKQGLWETNGTAAGTQELGVVGVSPTLGLEPSDMTVFNGTVLFNGLDAAGNHGLWVTDGTGAGTHEITGIANTAATGLDPTDMTVYNGEVYFNGDDAAGNDKLWQTNGTPGGTFEISSTALNPQSLTSLTPPTWAVTPNVLNDFSWAQGWNASTDYVREVVPTDTDPSGGADYVGFGTNHVTIAAGEATPNGPGFANSTSPIDDFGTAQGYTAAAQRGAADTGNAGATAPTVYGQGFAGVYWYDTTGGTSTDPTYQSTPNLYPDFGTHEGWTPANGFDVVKAQSTDTYASILGFGDAGIVVGPQAFNPNALSPSPSYVIPFAAGNNSGWDQTVDVRSFVDNTGQAIDLNGDGITDFVGMGPNGLEFALGSVSGTGQYTLGALQSAQINGSNSDFGEAQGWTDSTTVRDIVEDPKTGFDDIIAFGAAGVYVSMGQDPSTHGGQPFGQKYLALNNFGTDQGWSNAQTPRLVGDVSGDGIPDIVGFGANSTFTALGSYNSSGQLIFTMDPSATINDYGFNEGWSESNTVRTLANVDGSGTDSLVVSGASNTHTIKFG
jgi:ELWxxDGT repeat protein